MTIAFQVDAFQATAFQTRHIVSTAKLQLPIDFWLMKEPNYSATGRTYEKMPGKASTRVRFGQGGNLGGASSFSVTSSNKGYD